MFILQSDQSSRVSVAIDSASEAGPSSLTLDKAGRMNGLTNGNGFSQPMTNGSTKVPSPIGNGTWKYASVARVSLPGTTLYDDPYVDREEFVRLVIQSLRDVGYIASAATLEAESGYSLEAPDVSDFRQHILNAEWSEAEALLPQLVFDGDTLSAARFLIGRQKYLELLDARRTTDALLVLREELAPALITDLEQLHVLSSLIMCSDPGDLRRLVFWTGASVSSRQALLADLQQHIPTTKMIPQRRFATLLEQARHYQRERCIFHNAPMNPASFSLFSDHQCDQNVFPRVTTARLEGHTDEVWNVAWSHDGLRLASASKDKTAIIWRMGHEEQPSTEGCEAQFTLRDHPYPVGALAWSLDDSILLTSADNAIILWDTKTGKRITTVDAHTETVSALIWLPDNSGFLSASLDRKVIAWDVSGKQVDEWEGVPIRVTDMAITPDMKQLVVVGMGYQPTGPSPVEGAAGRPNRDSPAPSAAGTGNNTHVVSENRIVVYNFKTKATELSIPVEGELTSVKISSDSQFALINHAPDAIHLLSLADGHLEQKYKGQRQRQHVIRSCFGGIDGNFIVTGSEDRNVYLWHRDTGLLLEILSGHGNGSVNCVAWNPRNERMFASCSDDGTIRIWEPQPPAQLVDSTQSVSDVPVNGKGKARVSTYWDEDADEAAASSLSAA